MGLESELTLTLVFHKGAFAGRLLEFRGPRTVSVGRDIACDVPIPEPKASRRHCAIDIAASAVTLKDLASTNGTFVNGERVGLRGLEHGDTIRVGDTDLGVEIAREPGTVKITRQWDGQAPPAKAPAAPGDLEGYEVRGVLGVGASGIVYEALDPKGRVVALKVLKTGPLFDEDDRQRFVRAAEITTLLDHPNLVRTLAWGGATARPFMVMELVRGETLQARIDREGRLPWPLVLRVGRQVALALEHARTRDVVHRDVKPGNIVLQPDGTAKLTDFGLAKSITGGGTSGLTIPGIVVGTLAYMSPEQLSSSATVDHRSDIYSLGATMYQALSGQYVLSIDGTDEDVCQRIEGQDPVPLERLVPDLPVLVARLVMRSLARRPEDRFQRAQELVRLIETLTSPATRTTAS